MNLENIIFKQLEKDIEFGNFQYGENNYNIEYYQGKAIYTFPRKYKQLVIKYDKYTLI